MLLKVDRLVNCDIVVLIIHKKKNSFVLHNISIIRLYIFKHVIDTVIQELCQFIEH